MPTLIGAPALATGGVNSAPLGTTLPTDAAAALPAGIVRLGLIGEDGLSETMDRSTEQVRAWGGSLARVVQTEFGLSYSFVFLDTSQAVLTEIHGEDNVTATTDGTTNIDSLAIALNQNPLPRKVFVFDVKDGDNKIRIVLPNAQITEVGDVSYTHSDVIRYEVTVTAYPDENGNEGYKYLAGPDLNTAA